MRLAITSGWYGAPVSTPSWDRNSARDTVGVPTMAIDPIAVRGQQICDRKGELVDAAEGRRRAVPIHHGAPELPDVDAGLIEIPSERNFRHEVDRAQLVPQSNAGALDARV